MDAKSTFLNDPEQSTRQDPATSAFSSNEVTIIHPFDTDTIGNR